MRFEETTRLHCAGPSQCGLTLMLTGPPKSAQYTMSRISERNAPCGTVAGENPNEGLIGFAPHGFLSGHPMSTPTGSVPTGIRAPSTLVPTSIGRTALNPLAAT